MHRRRVTLSSRTERLTERIGHGSILVRGARALERQGVIATYDVHDRMLGNRRARSRFGHSDKPGLDAVQRLVLEELRENDYAVIPLSELFPNVEVLQGVAREGATFRADVEHRLAEGDTRAADRYKDYLIRRQGRGDEIDLSSPWLACCLSDRLLDVANTYLGMWSKLEYVDFWYSQPLPAGSDRIQSQRWHRDFDDRHLLKAFLYLVDVDEETGPLEFVAGSARGAAARFLPWRPASPKYPSPEDFQEHVPRADVRTFTAPAGSLILCNTSGFHRGGFATGKPRILATATYCSPASLESLTEFNYTIAPEERRSLSGAQLFAIPEKPHRRAAVLGAGRTALVALFVIALLFVLLPEALGDHPYDVF